MNFQILIFDFVKKIVYLRQYYSKTSLVKPFLLFMKSFVKVFGMLVMALPGAVSVSAETISATTGDGIVQMSDLDLSNITCYQDGGIAVRANKSTAGNPITMKGNVYESGVGTHAPSKAVVDLKGATEFYCLLGLDDEAKSTPDGAGVVDYTVTLYKDKEPEVRLNGSVARTDAAPVTVSLTDLADYDYLVLDIANGTYSWDDHVDFADARFVYSGEQPVIIAEKNMYPDPNKPSIIELPAVGPNGEEIIPLSSLDITLCTNGWGTIKKDKSIDGNTLTLKGQEYASGIGMHATGKVVVKLNGAVTAFHAVLGIDDEVSGNNYGTNQARCYYNVVLRKQNGEEFVVSTGEIAYADGTIADIHITEKLSDYKYLILEFDEGVNNGSDHVDVANAYFEYVEQNSTRPEIVNENTIKTGLNCATTMFSQPGVKFMHKLRSNNPDIQIEVKNLPAGLTFNAARCLVEGVINEEGEYSYTAVARAGEEVTETPVSLTVSSNLQQPVPHMGWLSWNVVQGDISEAVVKTATDNMISSGLRDAGYNCVLMDDLWHGTRAEGTNKPRPNADRFPNGLKPVADYVHEHGMKFGLYTDAANHTCAGAFGSYGYETIDAKQYAEWEIDYVKCDYCGAPGDVKTAKERYTTMGKALKKTGRNIIFHICEWGVRNPWEWGAEALGSSWRVTYDVRDGWNCRQGGIGMIQSLELMKDLWIYNGVNRWNDADMLCVGINGTGKSSSDLVVGTPGMTKTEYRSQFAMWCMWSSPLSLSFDIRKPISDVDLAIMTNPELIAIDQDRMGQAAEYLGVDENECYLFAKDLENGDVAIAVINMSSKKQTYTFDFSKIPALDATVTYSVRDLQNRKDCQDATGSIADVSIAKHETVVYRLHDKAKDTGDSGLKAIADGAFEDMTVSAADGVVTVCVKGTEGASKRVLVSDLGGRVIGSATSSSACVTVPVHAAAGVYVVNVIGGGQTRSVKVQL